LLVSADNDDLRVETFALEKAFFFADEDWRLAEGRADDADANNIVGVDRTGKNRAQKYHEEINLGAFHALDASL